MKQIMLLAKITPGVGTYRLFLADTLVFEKDVVAPLGEEMWNISK